jgi:hypothetical protein
VSRARIDKGQDSPHSDRPSSNDLREDREREDRKMMKEKKR